MSLPLIDNLKRQTHELKREVSALYLAVRDPRTPWFAKAAAGLVVAYALSPIDLIPDFIPVLGYLDDLILVPLGIIWVLKLIPPEIMAECRTQTAIGKQPLPRSWRAAAVIAAIWLMAPVLIGRLVLRSILGSEIFEGRFSF